MLGLLRLANHSTSGGTSARRWNSAAVSSRLPGAIRVGSWSVMASLVFVHGSPRPCFLLLIKYVIENEWSEGEARVRVRP